MKIEGSYRFGAPPEQVWALLLDPAALAVAIPGCEKLEPLGEGMYNATLSIGIAVFKGAYDGKVSLSNQVPPRSYDLQIEGSGRPGFVKGIGHITLEPDGPVDHPTATMVRVVGDAQVGGPILAVGSRLVVPTAKRLIDQFFEAMQERLGTLSAQP